MICPICEKTGQAINTNAHVYCEAFEATVCMAHCSECQYHSEQASLYRCTYKSAEDYRKEAEMEIRAQLYDARKRDKEDE